MSIYGCHNKPRPVKDSPIWVQDGYVTNEDGTQRIDRMVQIPYVMSTDCQYTKMHPNDPHCAGCVHK